jgi:hypothetical protein
MLSAVHNKNIELILGTKSWIIKIMKDIFPNLKIYFIDNSYVNIKIKIYFYDN